MITDILGGKTGAADAASSAKQAIGGRKGADASPNGFSDALSDLDQDVPSQGRDDVLDDGEPSEEDRLSAGEKPATRKPIIDLRPESLRRTPERSESVLDAVAKVVAANDEKQLTPAEKKLRDALATAKAIVLKSDELAAARKPDANGEKAESEEVDAGLDLSILDADDSRIADVLSLLGGEVAASELQAAMPKNAGGPQGKRQKDAEDRVQTVGTNGAGETGRFSLASASSDSLSMPADREASVPGTGQFRFTNARGDGQSLNMTVDERSGERPSVEFKASSNAAVENVTVLESRRFLGLAQNSNSANLTAMLSGNSEWAAAMHPSSELSNVATQSSTGTVVNTLKLQMNPHDLGSVTAMLRLHGEALNVHLTVETRAAYMQLSEDSSGILDALRAQGFAVEQVTISIAPTADSEGAGGQQGQQGQTGPQTQADGGRQGSAAGRGQEQAGNRHSAELDARNTNDAASDSTAGTPSGGTRPGDLYL
jgi:chemotaxis protein MotD